MQDEKPKNKVKKSKIRKALSYFNPVGATINNSVRFFNLGHGAKKPLIGVIDDIREVHNDYKIRNEKAMIRLQDPDLYEQNINSLSPSERQDMIKHYKKFAVIYIASAIAMILGFFLFSMSWIVIPVSFAMIFIGVVYRYKSRLYTLRKFISFREFIKSKKW